MFGCLTYFGQFELIDTQIKYLHEYQKTVYEKISPYLNEEEKEWLAAETGVK